MAVAESTVRGRGLTPAQPSRTGADGTNVSIRVSGMQQPTLNIRKEMQTLNDSEGRKSEEDGNDSVELDPEEKQMLEMSRAFNYGGTTTLRNSVNKEAVVKIQRMNMRHNSSLSNQKGTEGKTDSSLKELRSIDKAVVVRKPPVQT